MSSDVFSQTLTPVPAHAVPATRRAPAAHARAEAVGAQPVQTGPGSPAVGPAAHAAATQERLDLVHRILQETRRDLSFTVDETTGKTIVRVVHPGTGEVLRQIPSEELLALAARLDGGEPLTSLGLDQLV